ncbi:MAG: RDD family protein [Bacteroidota bacterium]
MVNDFTKVMAKKTDRELAKIVKYDKLSYHEDAITAAEAEIQQRGIDIHNLPLVEVKDVIEEEVIKDDNLVRSIVRLLHLIIDIVIIYFFNVIVGIAVVFSFGNSISDSDFEIYFLVFFYLTSFIYYAFLEYKFQRTVGKFVTGTIVVTSTGDAPTFGEIMRRTFCRLIPFDGFSFIFSRNGFHDKYSDTRVIKGKRTTDKIAPADILHN